MLNTIFENQTLISAPAAWFLAQFIKTLIDYRLSGKFNPERLTGSGGMPSSHSATVTALAVSALMRYGAASSEFSFAFILALVVMYDARGVRLETGKQAKILNAILSENPFEWKGEILEERLKELVGHTPLQVVVGALLGFAVALLLGFTVYA